MGRVGNWDLSAFSGGATALNTANGSLWWGVGVTLRGGWGGVCGALRMGMDGHDGEYRGHHNAPRPCTPANIHEFYSVPITRQAPRDKYICEA